MLFFSEEKLSFGGTPKIKVLGTDLKELKAFYEKWDGSFAFAPANIQEHVKRDLSRRQKDAMRAHALNLGWQCPAKRVGLTTTREHIGVLVPVSQKILLTNQGIHELTARYFPVLNMILRQQLAETCPGGMTLEMRKFYESEIKGKIIDLVKSHNGVILSGHSDVKSLNAFLDNFDLGRRSDLNYYDNAQEGEWLSGYIPSTDSPRPRRKEETVEVEPSREETSPVPGFAKDDVSAAWLEHKRKIGL